LGENCLIGLAEGFIFQSILRCVHDHVHEQRQGWVEASLSASEILSGNAGSYGHGHLIHPI